MQDKYVGDVGDFGKYILLNMIINSFPSKDKRLRLGVNWYYVTYEKGKESDGKHTSYLYPSHRKYDKYRRCDPALHHELWDIVEHDKRRIKEIEDRNFLPVDTVFYAEPLDDPDGKPVDRGSWFLKSLDKFENTDIIFLDPDNGLQTDKVKKTQKKGVKYVFRDEIQTYFKDHSLIIYNHRDRSPSEKYDEKIRSIKPVNMDDKYFKVFRFMRVAVRDYIFLIHEKNFESINQGISNLLTSPYNFLFDPYDFTE